MSSPADRFRQRAASRNISAGGGGEAPFSSFLERYEERRKRSRGKRRMLVASIGVHILVFGGLMLVSAWKVDELLGRRVEVKVMNGEVDGEREEAGGKAVRKQRVNVGRAVGFRFVATPEGTRLDARSDLEPTSQATSHALEQLARQQLLPSLHYPEAAKPPKLRGAVTVWVDVEATGRPSQVVVKQPCVHPLLCEASRAAVAAVKTWPVADESAPAGFAIAFEYRLD